MTAPPAGATVREWLANMIGSGIVAHHGVKQIADDICAGLRIPPDAAPSSLVCVPRVPTKAMRLAMQQCEGGDFSYRGGWTHILKAAGIEDVPEDPDTPNLTLCSFRYLADELVKRGATVTPAPHGGNFAAAPATPRGGE